MPRTLITTKWRTLLLGSFILLLILLAGCGGAASGGMSSPSNGAGSAAMSVNTNASSSSNQQNNSSKSTSAPVQYLIKTLKVSMSVKDTRDAADEIQTWIGTKDPRSFSAGIDYEQAGNNLYNITLSFSVQANLYPQIERYVRDYAPQHGGQLLSLNETVQDVTNDYIDTQSRLTNLKGEQARLLDLLSHAQALGDVVSIEDKLTAVEGQIEQIEAHLKALNNQVTFYTVTIALQPVDTAAPPPQNSAWSVGQVFHDAFAASLGFAQGLATFLIWLLAFSLYIVPVALLSWLWLRWRARSQLASMPKATSASMPEPAPPPETPVAP
jgi:Domain of unknown function (DUF4349)